MARNAAPVAPRHSAPDLPDVLDDVDGLRARSDVFQSRVGGLGGQVDAAHSQLTECVIAPASVDRLDLTGAALVDVDTEELRATELVARNGRWRSVRVTGGRVGTLDLSGAELDGVELRGIRIDYLSLGGARVSDLLIADCTILALDLPQATVERVRFDGTRADEVDNRGLRARHLDLRGLEALSYLDPAALRGATLTARQVELLAPAFAASLGIDVRD